MSFVFNAISENSYLGLNLPQEQNKQIESLNLFITELNNFYRARRLQDQKQFNALEPAQRTNDDMRYKLNLLETALWYEKAMAAVRNDPKNLLSPGFVFTPFIHLAGDDLCILIDSRLPGIRGNLEILKYSLEKLITKKQYKAHIDSLRRLIGHITIIQNKLNELDATLQVEVSQRLLHTAGESIEDRLFFLREHQLVDISLIKRDAASPPRAPNSFRSHPLSTQRATLAKEYIRQKRAEKTTQAPRELFQGITVSDIPKEPGWPGFLRRGTTVRYNLFQAWEFTELYQILQELKKPLSGQQVTVNYLLSSWPLSARAAEKLITQQNQLVQATTASLNKVFQSKAIRVLNAWRIHLDEQKLMLIEQRLTLIELLFKDHRINIYSKPLFANQFEALLDDTRAIIAANAAAPDNANYLERFTKVVEAYKSEKCIPTVREIRIALLAQQETVLAEVLLQVKGFEANLSSTQLKAVQSVRQFLEGNYSENALTLLEVIQPLFIDQADPISAAKSFLYRLVKRYEYQMSPDAKSKPLVSYINDHYASTTIDITFLLEESAKLVERSRVIYKQTSSASSAVTVVSDQPESLASTAALGQEQTDPDQFNLLSYRDIMSLDESSFQDQLSRLERLSTVTNLESLLVQKSIVCHFFNIVADEIATAKNFDETSQRYQQLKAQLRKLPVLERSNCLVDFDLSLRNIQIFATRKPENTAAQMRHWSKTFETTLIPKSSNISSLVSTRISAMP